MADARGVRRRVPVAAPPRRGVKLRQLEPSVARSLQHRDLRPDAVESHHAVHPTAITEVARAQEALRALSPVGARQVSMMAARRSDETVRGLCAASQ